MSDQLKNLDVMIARIERISKHIHNSSHPSYLRIRNYLVAAIRMEVLKQRLIDTGNLRNSIDAEITEDGSKIIIMVGSYGVKYAAIHELGGEIRPKSSKYLAIPLNRRAKTGSPRNFNLGYFKNPKTGKRLLYDKSLPKNKTTGGLLKNAYMYVLKESVTIKARPYIVPGIKKSIPKIIEILKGVMDE